jgi:hypothetical protein
MAHVDESIRLAVKTIIILSSAGVDKFVLVVGNARSGTTIVGSIIDSHPRMLCANETASSAQFWRNRSRDDILSEIRENSARNLATGRFSEGYRYAIETPVKSDIAVYADKIWNPALLLLAGDFGLLNRLADTLCAPIALVHCVRNPFDVIATMHRRSKAPLEDRARWFFMHCDAALSLYSRCVPIYDLASESLISNPAGVSSDLFRWIGYCADDDHLSRIDATVHGEVHQSRLDVAWPDALVREIEERAAEYPFLSRYTFAN